MTKRTDKAVSDRAVVAQANKIDLPEHFGLTKAEFKTVEQFNALLQSRIDTAPIEPITARAELVSQKKFPNNEDAQREVDPNAIEDDALRFVLNSALGYPSVNLRKDAPIDRAANDMAAALTRLTASPADHDREVSLAKKVKWLAQMQTQQAFKDSLSPVFDALHHLNRGYTFEPVDQTQSAVSSDDALKMMMG